MISVIIPSRTDEYAKRLLESIENSQPGTSAHAVVGDNGLSQSMRSLWPLTTFVTVPRDPFVFSQSINMCVAVAPKQNDILIIGDDSVIKSRRWLEKISALLSDEKNKSFGMISPQIIGNVATPDQNMPCPDGVIVECLRDLCFVAVFIRRSAWDIVGQMDERFVGYGYDDTDYCIRARDAGWKLGVTSDVIAQHGVGQYEASATYRTYPDVGRLAALNQEIFAAKWSKR